MKSKQLLIFKNQKFIYFTGENSPKENEEVKLFKKKYFNIIQYIKAHYKEVYIKENEIQDIIDLMEALFGEYKISGIGFINNPSYTQRYFYYSLLESEVSEKEWNEVYKNSFEKMKPVLKEWMINKSTSVINRLEATAIQNKHDIYKLLHLLFYVGALSNADLRIIYTINSLIEKLRKQNPTHDFTDIDQNEIRTCLTENPSNKFLTTYLQSLFEHGYNNEYILEEKEIIELQNNTFKQYLKENHTISEIINCWRDTLHKKFISNNNGYGRYEYLHSTEATILMKEYAMNHFDKFIKEIIIYYTPNENHTYGIWNIVEILWGNWNAFYNYINNIKEESPSINEFKEFLEKFKNTNYSNQVFFEFKHIHIYDDYK